MKNISGRKGGKQIMNKWRFPSNNHGVVNGFNDSGIHTFTNNPYSALAREIIQNSLDASLNNEKVIVEFNQFQIQKNDFPDLNNFIDVLNKCRNQAMLYQNDKKAFTFFDNAIRQLESENHINFLRISDFNTKGLLGSKKDYNSDWINLVKSIGASDKNQQAGGSFGIGKAAPFVCSAFQTVFYSTLDKEGVSASQGVAKFMSFEETINNKKIFTQGTGFYSQNEENKPIFEMTKFGDFRRLTSGTDIFIVGFIEDKKWKQEIIGEIINNYFYAIFKDTLEIKVEETIINHDTLEVVLSEYALIDKNCSLAESYYNVLKSQDTKWFTEDLNNLGIVKIGLLQQDFDLATKKIAMIRKPWMKIKDHKLGNASSHTGVLIIEGDDLNSLLRKVENPAHNNWEAKRASDNTMKQLASDVLTKLKNFINDKITKLIEHNLEDELDIVGLDNILPYDDDGDSDNENKEKDYLNPIIHSISIRKTEPKINKYTEKDEGNYVAFALDDDKIDIGIDPEESLGGRGKKKTKKKRILPPGGVGSDENPYHTSVKIEPEFIKFIIVDKKKQKYKLLYRLKNYTKKHKIKIFMLDEQGVASELSIVQAVSASKILDVKGNTLIVDNYDIGETKSIDVFFETDQYFSAEVIIYEIKE